MCRVRKRIWGNWEVTTPWLCVWWFCLQVWKTSGWNLLFGEVKSPPPSGKSAAAAVRCTCCCEKRLWQLIYFGFFFLSHDEFESKFLFSGFESWQKRHNRSIFSVRICPVIHSNIRCFCIISSIKTVAVENKIMILQNLIVLQDLWKATTGMAPSSGE